jgi:hypothetical protein
MSVSIQDSNRRKLFCVMSARALPYAEKGVESLFANLLEPVSLTIITDGDEDKITIAETVSRVPLHLDHKWSVYSQNEADERASSVFRRYPQIGQFRRGHPCWRKLTDPLLFSATDEASFALSPARNPGCNLCGSHRVACYLTKW